MEGGRGQKGWWWEVGRYGCQNDGLEKGGYDGEDDEEGRERGREGGKEGGREGGRVEK